MAPRNSKPDHSGRRPRHRLCLSGVTLPLWATNTLSLLSSLTIPLMLLMLGTSLARIR